MEILEVARKIDGCVNELDSMQKNLLELAKSKVKASVAYEKQIAVTLISLRNGKEYTLEGETIVSPPTTIMEKIAKGICWEESLEKDKTEIQYNNLVKSIDITKAKLNGYQSIYKHLGDI